jgi:hypothetical protein
LRHATGRYMSLFHLSLNRAAPFPCRLDMARSATKMEGQA